MAAVSISVGGIAIELGDEDESAKALTRLALKTVTKLVEYLADETDEEEVAGDAPLRGELDYRCCGEVFLGWQGYNGHVEKHVVAERARG